MASSVEAFIRFKDESGSVKYGSIPRSALKGEIKGTEVEVLNGDPFSGLKGTGSKSTVAEVSYSRLWRILKLTRLAGAMST